MASIWDIANNPQVPQTPTPSSNSLAPGQVSGTASNGWFNGGNYGQSGNWYDTPIAENIREQDQRLAFNAWGARQGIGENDSTFSRWYQSQFPRFQSAYGQATLYNPMMTIDDFLATLPSAQALRNQYMALSPNARGAQYNTYAPNVRWLPR